MRARLARLDDPPHVLAAGWDAADVPAASHDTVLAANIAAPLQAPGAFLPKCLASTRRAVVWSCRRSRAARAVLCGLPSAQWHGEDETPGIDSAPRRARRARVGRAREWTFSGIVLDLERLAHYLADGWDGPKPPSRDDRASADQARSDPRGHRLDIPRNPPCSYGGIPMGHP
jgi:hypothetical protein